MSISAILFDLDGTLVDTERESAEAMARALASGQGVEIDQADRDGIIGHSWIEIFRNLKGKYSQIEWELDRLIAETARIRELMLADTGLEPLPGVLELLDRFSALPKAVVTGSSKAEAEHALELLGIRDQFKAL
ncbi:MAG: HAD family hydrolase, partial [Deltaproteobacteria bacterium]|nr:HAD family hydrolase [Deltaproteobacteria bacterium]